jgi:serine/threonine protein kinase
MDRIANAAPCVVDASQARLRSDFGEETGVRAIAGILPESERDTYDPREADACEPSQARPLLLAPGTCVDGKYIICDVLGMGGAAVVYAAEQVGLKRVVAFKLYGAEAGMGTELVERFQREAELLARVHHENVVAVFDSGRMPDGSPYLVVQRLSGESLATRLAEGALPVPEAVALTRQALHALVALADAGITHRDVKPDNLVLDRLPDGRTVLKLVDFGIAKDTAPSASADGLEALVGTPHYMAPEQVRGAAVDARADLYALGATLYEMLTGRPPHMGETLNDLATATLFDPISPVRELRGDCPEALERLVMRALARDPAERFASAREMLSALDGWEAAERAAAERRVVLRLSPDDDTLRLPTRRPERSPLRVRVRNLGLSLLIPLAAVGVLSVSRELREQPAAPQATASSVEASDSPVATLALQSGAFAGAIVVETRDAALELLRSAQRAAVQLVDFVRHSGQSTPRAQ